MSALFSPLQIRHVTLKNRIVVSPMCQYSSVDGFADDWHLVHLGSRAVGGAALVISEATAVSPEGRISPADLGIWKDEHIAPLQKIVRFIQEQDCVAGIQLAHAGRKASHTPPWQGGKEIPVADGGWKTFAPSPIPFREEETAPEELDEAGIKKVIADFRAAAARAFQAGFTVIEIHAAHGYLINEFLSPLSNQRTDSYGGSFENRIRLLMEVIHNIKDEWPKENLLFVRLSVSEWANGGWTTEDSIRLAHILKDNGVDLIDCSSGGNTSKVQIPVAPGYQVSFADEIRKTGIKTGAVGLITTAAQAEHIIIKGQADLIFLARQMLRNPYFPLQAADQLGAELHWPVQYERAKPVSGTKH